MAQTLVLGMTANAADRSSGGVGFFEISGWVFGAVALVLAYYTWRRERTATAAVAVERQRFEGLELLSALDEMDRQFAEVQREHAAGHSEAAEAALRRWREAARSARTHVGPGGSRYVVDARTGIEYAERRTQAMAGVGGAVNVGAKTMGDAIEAMDSCHSKCADLRAETHRAVYGA
jgi:hypothetical protein